jgi:hypothetical protein
LLNTIKEKYDNLIKSIRMFWHQEMAECESISLLDFPTILAKKYGQSIGESLKQLNENLLEYLAGFRIEARPSNRIHSSSLNSIKTQSLLHKENRAVINS